MVAYYFKDMLPIEHNYQAGWFVRPWEQAVEARQAGWK
jgi:hypothetical protein